MSFAMTFWDSSIFCYKLQYGYIQFCFTDINLSTNPPSTKADFFPQLCSYRTLPTQRNLILPYKYLRRPNKSLHMLVLQFQIQRDEASLRHVYPLFYHVVPEEML